MIAVEPFTGQRNAVSTKDKISLDSISFAVLAILGNGNMHGYEILKRVQSEIDPDLSVPTLYRRLHKLEKEDLITRVKPPPDHNDDPRRRYYGLTNKGRRIRREEYERRYQYMETVGNLFDDPSSVLVPSGS